MFGFGRGLSIIIAAAFLVLAVIVCGLVILPGTAFFGYLNHVVGTNEVGVLLIDGQFTSVLPPGRYTDLQPFRDIVNVKIEGIGFSATDNEVLTDGAEQRLGIQVDGTVFRPSTEAELREKWAYYRNIYLDDAALLAQMQGQIQQAMKTCVGERSFEEAAVGQSRNDLSVCIQQELDRLLSDYGLTVRNVVAANIIISPQAQQRIDSITDARNQAELAIAEATRVYAEGQRDISEQQIQIQITQGAIQEQLRAQATQGAIQLTLIAVERQVLEADMANEEYEAERRREIQLIQLEIDRLVAQSETFTQAQIAQIINSNPRYAQYLRDELTAEALSNARLVYLASGTNPLQIIGSDDLMLSLDMTSVTPVPSAAPNP